MYGDMKHDSSPNIYGRGKKNKAGRFNVQLIIFLALSTTFSRTELL